MYADVILNPSFPETDFKRPAARRSIQQERMNQ
jgi:hypothetical protein